MRALRGESASIRRRLDESGSPSRRMVGEDEAAVGGGAERVMVDGAERVVVGGAERLVGVMMAALASSWARGWGGMVGSLVRTAQMINRMKVQIRKPPAVMPSTVAISQGSRLVPSTVPVCASLDWVRGMGGGVSWLDDDNGGSESPGGGGDIVRDGVRATVGSIGGKGDGGGGGDGSADGGGRDGSGGGGEGAPTRLAVTPTPLTVSMVTPSPWPRSAGDDERTASARARAAAGVATATRALTRTLPALTLSWMSLGERPEY